MEARLLSGVRAPSTGTAGTSVSLRGDTPAWGTRTAAVREHHQSSAAQWVPHVPGSLTTSPGPTATSKVFRTKAGGSFGGGRGPSSERPSRSTDVSRAGRSLASGARHRARWDRKGPRGSGNDSRSGAAHACSQGGVCRAVGVGLSHVLETIVSRI